MKLKGKVAVVTGASSGMGRAIAVLFAREGATVYAIARRKERLEEIATEAFVEGCIIPVEGDVTHRTSMNELVDRIYKEHGKLDLLVNNAGIMDQMMPIGEVQDELWDHVMDVNLGSVMNLSRKAVQIMEKAGGGQIINIASIGGLQGCRAGASYTASKYALIGLTKNIAFAYMNHGIRCNAICPGAIATEIAVGITNPSPLGMERAVAGMGYAPKPGSSEDIAYVALFLASEESKYINGVALPVDGGWTVY